MVGGENFVESKLPGGTSLQLVERGQCGMEEVVFHQERTSTFPAHGLGLAMIMPCGAVTALDRHKVGIGHNSILPDQSVRVTLFSPRGVSTSRPLARVR